MSIRILTLAAFLGTVTVAVAAQPAEIRESIVPHARAKGKKTVVLPGPAVLCPAPGPSCRLTATLTTGGVQAGSTRTTVKKGRTKLVSVTLTRAAAATLRRSGSLTLDLDLRVQRSGAAAATLAKSFTVTAPA